MPQEEALMSINRFQPKVLPPVCFGKPAAEPRRCTFPSLICDTVSHGKLLISRWQQ